MPPTAKGFLFLTLEDETGFANVVVRPAVVERYRTIVVREPLVLVEGHLEVEQRVVNVLATRFVPLELAQAGIRFRGRDR
jgi:error-prone DNA polymerase